MGPRRVWGQEQISQSGGQGSGSLTKDTESTCESGNSHWKK